jgi:dienelactone hydrolase
MRAIWMVLFVVGCTTTNPDSVGGGPDDGGGASGDSDGGGNANPDGNGNANGDGSVSGDGSAPGGGAHDYGQDGPDAVTMKSFTVSRNGSTFTEIGWIPTSSGAHPVVILSSGLQQPAAAYAPYGKRLASWGVIALLRDDPGILGQTSTVVDDVAYLANTWLAAQNADSSSALFGRVDTGRVGLAGHSRGGQVSLLAAEGALKGSTKAVFGLDPVDGSMSGATARGAMATIGVPIAFIGETTDSSGSSACAPAADNYQVLYTAAATPALAITAVGADHTQFEDPASCSFCTLCTAGTADGKVVLAYSVKYLMTFFARELNADASIDATLGSAGDVAAGLVSVQSK